MNWNIEHLSNKKLAVPGMAQAMARVVVSQNVDILIILEVKQTNFINAMNVLSAALNAEEHGGANDWDGWFVSGLTGGEYYVAFIRDLGLVRPVFPVAGIGPPGTDALPLTDLRENQFEVWPADFPAPVAYPLAGSPDFPILDMFASPVAPRGTKAARFQGQALGNGGFSLGRGFRLPTLLLFRVHTPAGNDYLLPFVACHYAAVRGSKQRNVLGQTQISQLMNLHIAQLFRDNNFGGSGASGYLDLRNGAAHTAVLVEEVCFTGDFNVDFMRNTAGGNNHQAKTNRSALNALTPTVQYGGSAAPAAAPGGAPAGGPPPVPYVPPLSPPPDLRTINQQLLKAAVTARATIMRPYPLPVPAPVLPVPAPYGSAAFDNFFYGGTHMAGAAILAAPDAGLVINVPANVRRNMPAAALPQQFNVVPIATHYAAQPATKRKNADLEPGLQGGAGVLSRNARLVGARFLSDHLPTILDFNLP